MQKGKWPKWSQAKRTRESSSRRQVRGREGRVAQKEGRRDALSPGRRTHLPHRSPPLLAFLPEKPAPKGTRARFCLRHTEAESKSGSVCMGRLQETTGRRRDDDVRAAPGAAETLAAYMDGRLGQAPRQSESRRPWSTDAWRRAAHVVAGGVQLDLCVGWPCSLPGHAFLCLAGIVLCILFSFSLVPFCPRLPEHPSPPPLCGFLPPACPAVVRHLLVRGGRLCGRSVGVRG